MVKEMERKKMRLCVLTSMAAIVEDVEMGVEGK